MTNYLILEYHPDCITLNWYEKFQNHEIELRYGNSEDGTEYDDYNLDKVRCAHILKHAAHLLWELRYNGENPSLRSGLKNDLSNYLYKISQGEGARASARNFIKSLLAIGMYCEVAECLQEYLSFVEDKPNQIQALDFNKIYADAGDIALFQEKNYEMALVYYRFAATQWKTAPEKETAQSSENLLKSERFNEFALKKWRDLVNSIEVIMRGKEPVSIIELCLTDRLQTIYADCIYKLQTYDIDCLQTAETLAQEVQHEGKLITDRLRLGAFMLESIRRNHLQAIIYTIGTRDHKPYDDVVIKAVRNSKGERFKEIRAFLASTKLGNASLTEAIYRFVEVMYEIDQILNVLRIKTPKMECAYYTTLRTFTHMLPFECGENRSDKYGRLSVMHVSYMNDPNEGLTVKKYIFGENMYSSFPEGRKTVNVPYVFLKCFTEKVDYLPMWELYGGHAEGVCVLIDWSEWKESSLYRVCYIRKEGNKYTIRPGENRGVSDSKAVKTHLNRIVEIQDKMDNTGKKVIERLISPILYLFKDSSYSYEQELRIMYYFDQVSDQFAHTRQEPPKLYVYTDNPIQIKEIILGPRFSKVSEFIPFFQEQLELMAKSTGTHPPVVSVSNIDFR